MTTPAIACDTLLSGWRAQRRASRDAKAARGRGGEGLVDHGAVAALEVQLGDDHGYATRGRFDDDRVLGVVAKTGDRARIDLDACSAIQTGDQLLGHERAVGEPVPGEPSGRYVEARSLDPDRRGPAVRSAERSRHVR